MKKIFLSATSPLMYLTEIPLIAVLIFAFIHTDSAGGAVGLYPLIVALICGIAFIFIYLFRVVIISFDEIRIIGPFTSKDRAIINKGKTLILTIRKRRGVKVTLFGNDGQRPALDWASGEDYVPVDINLFRERVIGKRGAVLKVLYYFGVEKEKAQAIFSAGEVYSTKELDVSVIDREGERDIRILFKETL